MTRAVLCGALGRMGRSILKLSLEYSDFQVVAGVEHPDCVRYQDLGEASGLEELKGLPLTSRLEEVLPLCDVVVEFSGNTTAALSHVKLSTLAGKGVVIGTTGFSLQEVEELRSCSEAAPVLLSPNMSLGVNLLFRLVEIAGKVLRGRGFDAEVLEIHHRFKKDAPSGTALRLENIIKESMGLKVGIYGREGVAERRSEEVGVMALRGGDVVGEHTVYFLGFGERLELTHRAGSRDIFARGAIEAAMWIKGKRPGWYSMLDVLGL
ncbi:MAG: 4-hydroxy-tetrahydrodipicolinate reductase [Aquificaceae bacterium]|nr:4-hydroxy-tetrahydrodipicolinate reductase [Aquificaceae bacterium]MCS7196850.1 4-hydroxy-tetrahydrodipicolinate reductase [Aquificaceae bacterium]MDW8033208.1 4-hydroxy-tetrahydrodipicolinate reductase [Aquificaceae bacterium]MDW8295034.1 4-hydroxy-tetrahydrodipicolinate reductase [Aquificaceae bacterium]